jgi:hypothetical protein
VNLLGREVARLKRSATFKAEWLPFVFRAECVPDLVATSRSR